MKSSTARASEASGQERHEILQKFLHKRTQAFYLSVMTGERMSVSDGIEIAAPDFFFGDHERDRKDFLITEAFIFGPNKESPRGTMRSHSLKDYARAARISRRDGELKWVEDDELVACARFLDHGRSFELVNHRVNIPCRMLRPFSVASSNIADFPPTEPTAIELIKSNGGWSNSANKLKLPPAECKLWSSWLKYVMSYFRPVIEEVGLVSAIEATQNARSVKPSIYEAILETFCPASNTCFTPVGELGLSLLEMKRVSGLPILGELYEEYFPTDQELKGMEDSSHRLLRRRGRVLRHLYIAFFTLTSGCSRQRIPIKKWLEHFSRDKGRDTALERDEETCPLSLDEMDVPEYLELAVFLSSWMGRYLFPDSGGDYVRIDIMMPAVLLSQGVKLSLCPPMVARLCQGLRKHCADGCVPKQCHTRYPSYYFYAWFVLHCPPLHDLRSVIDVDAPYLLRLAEHNARQRFDRLTWSETRSLIWDSRSYVISLVPELPPAQVKPFYCDAPKKRGGKWLPCYKTQSEEQLLHFEDEEWMKSVRPNMLFHRSQRDVYLEPYLPSRFARQFGYTQGLVGKPRTFAFRTGGSALDAWRAWKDFDGVNTGGHFKYPYSRVDSRDPGLRRSFAEWYTLACRDYLALGRDESYMSGIRLIFDKVATSGKAVPNPGENPSHQTTVAVVQNKGKRVAEGEAGNFRLKKPVMRLVIKPSSTHASSDKVVREKEAEPSESSTEERDEGNDIPLPKTPGGSLSPSSFGGNIGVPPSSPESSERLIYDTPEIQRSQVSGCHTDTVQEDQSSSDGLSVNTSEIFGSISGNDDTDNHEVGISAQETVVGEDGASTELRAETIAVATGSRMSREMGPPAGGGEVEGSSGVNPGPESQDLKAQKVKRHINFLRFCLENLSEIDPHEFAEESSTILRRLDLLRAEGVDVSVISGYVDKLFDFGLQYESILVCSARERRMQEIQPMLASLEKTIHAKTLEHQSLQEKDLAVTSLKLEVESLKREAEILHLKIQEKKALLNLDEFEARAARIQSLSDDLQEKTIAREALVTQLDNAADNEARKAAALKDLKSHVAKSLQGALDVLPS